MAQWVEALITQFDGQSLVPETRIVEGTLTFHGCYPISTCMW